MRSLTPMTITINKPTIMITAIIGPIMPKDGARAMAAMSANIPPIILPI